MTKRLLLFLYLIFSATSVCGDDFGLFSLDFVEIGSPGNADIGTLRPAGGVDYEYRIGQFEISREQVELANSAGNLGITLWQGERSLLTLRPEMPASVVTRNEAARFVNWLNEEQGIPHAYKFEFQPGESGYTSNANLLLWEPDDPGYDPDNLFRNSLTRYVLPTENEWFKAAYYNPTALDNGAGGYTSLPNTSGNTRLPPSDGVAVGLIATGPLDVELARATSFFGTNGMAGNVQEITETAWDRVNDDPGEGVTLLDGHWQHQRSLDASARQRSSLSPDGGTELIGFRVASIPEPSTVTLSLLPLLFMLHGRTRRSNHEQIKSQSH